jgi:hypothetical protein
MTPLELLAERAGIELEFIDARGETQKATQEAQRSLLEAVGLKAEDEAGATKPSYYCHGTDRRSHRRSGARERADNVR